MAGYAHARTILTQTERQGLQSHSASRTVQPSPCRGTPDGSSSSVVPVPLHRGTFFERRHFPACTRLCTKLSARHRVSKHTEKKLESISPCFHVSLLAPKFYSSSFFHRNHCHAGIYLSLSQTCCIRLLRNVIATHLSTGVRSCVR